MPTFLTLIPQKFTIGVRSNGAGLTSLPRSEFRAQMELSSDIVTATGRNSRLRLRLTLFCKTAILITPGINETNLFSRYLRHFRNFSLSFCAVHSLSAVEYFLPTS